MDTSPLTSGSNNRRRWPILVVVILVLAVLVGAIAFVAHELSEAEIRQTQREQEDFDRQLLELKSGKSKTIFLYCTRDTDALLRQLEGLAEVEELIINFADVSEVGMASVATLPRLRRLVLYAGGIADRGLAKIRGMASLEALELTNTSVTNEGLSILQELPNLKSLKIFCEPRFGVLNEAGLAHLKNLPKLETLSVTGGWASREAVAELQEQLPNCNVNEWHPPLKWGRLEKSRD